jgi:hypothetical protein
VNEKALAAKILVIAQKDLQKKPTHLSSQHAIREALKFIWELEPEDGKRWNFEMFCSILDLNPEYVRDKAGAFYLETFRSLALAYNSSVTREILASSANVETLNQEIRRKSDTIGKLRNANATYRHRLKSSRTQIDTLKKELGRVKLERTQAQRGLKKLQKTLGFLKSHVEDVA